MSIHQQAGDVRGRRGLQGKIGDLVHSRYLDSLITMINDDPAASQLETVTVDTAADSTDYTITINSVDITITSDSSATKAEIADAIADAVNAEPLVRGQVAAVSDGVDEIALTSTFPGLAFVFSESDSNLSSVATTANDEADLVEFGRLVLGITDLDDEDSIPAGLARSSILTAQVAQVDYTYNGGDIVGVRVIDKHSGAVLADVQHALATDKPTSTGVIVGLLNDILPANSVLAADAGASDEIDLTAEVAGLEFSAEVYTDSLSTDPSVTEVTGPTPATSILRAIKGVTVWAEDEETTTIGGVTVGYPGNAGMRCLQNGQIWVAKDSSETITLNQPVYVELGVSDDNGKFFNADSATRLLLPGATWKRQANSTTSDNIGAIAVSF